MPRLRLGSLFDPTHEFPRSLLLIRDKDLFKDNIIVNSIVLLRSAFNQEFAESRVTL